jgi:hypothetical protein
MNVFEALGANFKALSDNAEVIAKESFDETKERFIDLNKDQLLHGEKSTGESLGLYKNRSYAIEKNRLNPLPGLGLKDYKLKGSYYAGITLTIEGGKIVMTSKDPKSKWIEKNDDKRFGLNEVNREIYVNQSLRPVIIKKIIDTITQIR